MDLRPGCRPLRRGADAADARARGAPGGTRSPTRCCCSSTRRLHARAPLDRRELPLGEDFYAAQGIEIVDVDRGGRVTYHGPGQLVGYPIMRDRRHHRHLRTMESAIVAALRGEGIATRALRPRGPTTPACGSRSARSPRSACTCRAASPRTASPSTSTTTSSRSRGWCLRAAGVRMTSVARELGRASPTACASASRRSSPRASRRAPPRARSPGALARRRARRRPAAG